VLPESIRDFRFTWKGEKSITDIGRYKAIATLAYGEDGVKSVSEITYFWVIPIKGALITLGALLFIIFALQWMIRRYVRNMLILAGVDPDYEDEPKEIVKTKKDLKLASYSQVSAPLRSGVLDLRSRLDHVSETVDVFTTILNFVVQYYRFFVALVLLILSFIALVFYVGEVSDSETEYEVTIDEGDTERVLSDEEIRAIRPD
jgi:hypothetical protein